MIRKVNFVANMFQGWFASFQNAKIFNFSKRISVTKKGQFYSQIYKNSWIVTGILFFNSLSRQFKSQLLHTIFFLKWWQIFFSFHSWSVFYLCICESGNRLLRISSRWNMTKFLHPSSLERLQADRQLSDFAQKRQERSTWRRVRPDARREL